MNTFPVWLNKQYTTINCLIMLHNIIRQICCYTFSCIPANAKDRLGVVRTNVSHRILHPLHYCNITTIPNRNVMSTNVLNLYRNTIVVAITNLAASQPTLKPNVRSMNQCITPFCYTQFSGTYCITAMPLLFQTGM